MILLEVLATDEILMRENKQALLEKGAVEICSKEFQGGDDVIRLMIKLSPTIITDVTTFIVACLKTKTYINIFHDGTPIEGMTEDNVMKMMVQLMNLDSKNG